MSERLERLRDKAREHVLGLYAAGVSWEQIARAAGLNVSTIYAIRDGGGGARAATAQKVLAIESAAGLPKTSPRPTLGPSPKRRFLRFKVERCRSLDDLAQALGCSRDEARNRLLCAGIPIDTIGRKLPKTRKRNV